MKNNKKGSSTFYDANPLLRFTLQQKVYEKVRPQSHDFSHALQMMYHGRNQSTHGFGVLTLSDVSEERSSCQVMGHPTLWLLKQKKTLFGSRNMFSTGSHQEFGNIIEIVINI